MNQQLHDETGSSETRFRVGSGGGRLDEEYSMPVVSAAELLEVWESGHHASPGEQGLLLLSVVRPDLPAEVLNGWVVGQRDAALLTLRERIFGPLLEVITDCPSCNEALEMEFPVSAITTPASITASDQYALECPGFRIIYRLPTAGDLARLSKPRLASDREQSPLRCLMEWCVVRVNAVENSRDMEPVQATEADGRWSDGQAEIALVDLPDMVFARLEMAMAETVAAADPQAVIELALTCPACGMWWEAPFDIVSFLWQELDAWAKRLLREVHVLAANYGWSERAILALSPWRRRYYLDLIGA